MHWQPRTTACSGCTRSLKTQRVFFVEGLNYSLCSGRSLGAPIAHSWPPLSAVASPSGDSVRSAGNRSASMNASQQTPKDRDVRDYLAAEQTFLAWIRTGLAFMGFGFVVARFGLFLQQLALIEPAPKIGRHSVSIWFGTVMMLMGVGINAFSAWHHVRLVRQLNQGET